MWWHAPSRGAGCGLPCTSAGHPSRGTATLAATRAPHLGQRPRVFQTKVGMSGASAPGVAVGMRTVRAMAMLGEGGDPFVTLLRQQRAMERSLLDNMEQGPPLTASGSQRDTSTTLSRQLGDSGFAYTERGGTEGASDGCAPTPPAGFGFSLERSRSGAFAPAAALHVGLPTPLLARRLCPSSQPPALLTFYTPRRERNHVGATTRATIATRCTARSRPGWWHSSRARRRWRGGLCPCWCSVRGSPGL